MQNVFVDLCTTGSSLLRLRRRIRRPGPILPGRLPFGRRGARRPGSLPRLPSGRLPAGQPEPGVLVQVRRVRPVHRRLQDRRREPVQRRGPGTVQPGRTRRHSQDRVVHRRRRQRFRSPGHQGRQSGRSRRPGVLRPGTSLLRPGTSLLRTGTCLRAGCSPRPGVRSRRFVPTAVQTSSVNEHIALKIIIIIIIVIIIIITVIIVVCNATAAAAWKSSASRRRTFFVYYIIVLHVCNSFYLFIFLYNI